MTTSKQIYFEPSDIRAIQLECRNCAARVSCRVKDWKPEATICPNCPASLIDAKELFVLQKLAQSLNTLLTHGDTFGFQLRFELNESSN